MDYLLDASGAFTSPVTRTLVTGILVILVGSTGIIGWLQATKRVGPELVSELWARWRTWALLIPLLVGGILWTPLSAILLFTLVSLLCFHDFARATGLFREVPLVLVAVVGMLLLGFASLDHYPRLFFAVPALVLMVMAIVAILPDQPQGYLQRVALSCLGFMICGLGLGYLGFMANDPDYRPRLLLLLAAVQLNDVFAFCGGKLIGGPKLAPVTSPGKTRSGALTGMLATTLIVGPTLMFLFPASLLRHAWFAFPVGAAMSLLGILGDLTISSIKRDLGIKDMGTSLAGHGGFLDRFNSLIWVSPAFYHLISLLVGWGIERPIRLFTG